MSHTHRLGLLALVALCAASPLRAQDPRLDGRLDPTTRARLGVVLDSARRAGLPVDPLVQRALQGAARGAPSDRILAAVHRLQGELRTAREALGARSSEAELVAAAGAVRAGARPEDLAALRTARPGEPATVALATLADLVADGVPVQPAAQAVLTAVRRGATDEQLATMRRDVAGDIRGGAPGGAAAAVRAQGVRGAGAAGGPPSTIPRQAGRGAAAAAAGAAAGAAAPAPGRPPVPAPGGPPSGAPGGRP